MEIVYARNVNGAFHEGLRRLTSQGVPEPSRVGPVFVMPTPVVTVYNRPWERVLFDETRDANPFFHLMESVWMLAGRRDAVWLDRYVRNFSERFAEDNGEMHGAYGYRWRRHFNPEKMPHGYDDAYKFDQLLRVAEMLREDPMTRRAVLTMWDPEIDLGKPSLDLPCNTHVYFRARKPGDLEAIQGQDRTVPVLDITVCNRSNDAVMGAYGANAVHMSVMGEVIAGLAGMRLGRYYQVSNNFHVYERDLGKYTPRVSYGEMDLYTSSAINKHPLRAQPICGDSDDPETLREEAERVLVDCRCFCEVLTEPGEPLDPLLAEQAKSRWFRETVIPMQVGHDLYRAGKRKEAMSHIGNQSPYLSDWAAAGVAWIQRRIK